MGEESWSFRSNSGPVTVGSDELVIRSTPEGFVAAQRVRWRNGGYRDRARALLDLAGPLVLLALLALNLASLDWTGPATEWDPAAAVLTLVTGVAVVLTTRRIWRNYVRPRRLPLADVEEVVANEVEGTLRVATDSEGGLPWTGGGLFGRKIEVPTDEDFQRAVEALRLRGVPVYVTPEKRTPPGDQDAAPAGADRGTVRGTEPDRDRAPGGRPDHEHLPGTDRDRDHLSETGPDRDHPPGTDPDRERPTGERADREAELESRRERESELETRRDRERT